MAWVDRFDEPRRNIGCSIFGWLLFVGGLAFIVYVFLRANDYAGMIRQGKIVELPQFRTQFTASGKPLLSSTIVDKGKVETEDAPALGADPDKAKLTIVEFADFECPYSKQAAPIVRAVMAKYGDKVRFVYRDYPITDIHLQTREASIAAECAREQGKFWAYHDRLYQNAPALGYQSLLSYALQSGLEPRQFEKCLTDERYKDRVEKDKLAAEAIGVPGTPVFYFDGQRVDGMIPQDVFESIIAKMTK